MLKLAIVAVAIVAVLGAPKPEEERYKSRLDNINVKDVIKNDRLVENYIKCALGTGKCTPEAKDIKDQVLDGLIPEILETNCAKCTEDQKEKVRIILRHLRDHRREALDQILEKYDPKKELRTKYKEKYTGLAKEEGFLDVFE